MTPIEESMVLHLRTCVGLLSEIHDRLGLGCMTTEMNERLRTVLFDAKLALTVYGEVEMSPQCDNDEFVNL